MDKKRWEVVWVRQSGTTIRSEHETLEDARERYLQPDAESVWIELNYNGANIATRHGTEGAAA